jgi:elongation factor P--(R)-beta-lysine ligase
VDWQPNCTLEILRLRAQTLQKIRQFFAERAVLEVETPLLCSATGTDPNLDFFATTFAWPPTPRQLFLQTSPEFAMKRLLAAGSGSIYQICKAFRNGEAGRFHNPEFTVLEWYRIGYGLNQLMDEIAELMAALFAGEKLLQSVERVGYQALFKQYTGLDALAFAFDEYAAFAFDNNLNDAARICGQDHALWLDFIFSHQVQPNLNQNTLYMVQDYPACFSSLARLNKDIAKLTDRVELFINGVELGNGYYELNDATEQEARFDREVCIRQANQRPAVTKDKRLLAALDHGLPTCSGIALGLDRILMLLADSPTIADVLSFSIDKA